MTSTKPTADAFLATVKKSGLVEPERLQKVLAAYQVAGGDPENSLALAEFFVAQLALSKWQAEKLLQGKHKGYFLGKYRLLSLLGKGGMSSVFLAEHILMRRRCAIKVLPTKRVADSSYLARFHREAQAVAALDHPNIVRAYDVDHQTDRDAEIHFLVMEYVDGLSLQELVSGHGPCGFADAVDYIRQGALGLEHAHRAGMVHRDIKPGNLLVDTTGTVKLLDLGLARYFSSEGDGMALTIAHDEKVLGTADYLAPEQALDSHTVDHRADIYSLGCTLYFLLTGHPPFTEGTLAQRLMAHQTKEPPPVQRDRPDTPPSLSALLVKMMAKRPENRFDTAEEVAHAMWDWLVAHADADWKRAHPQLFGTLRASDTQLSKGTTAVPVAKPVMLTMTAETQEADTEIVARAAWPTGDLATESTAPEAKPEWSAFLAQVQPKPSTGSSSTKAAASPSMPARPKTDKQRPSSAEFDFLDTPSSDDSKSSSVPGKRTPLKSSPAKTAAVPKSKASGPNAGPPPRAPSADSEPNPADEAAFPTFAATHPSPAPAAPPEADVELVSIAEPEANSGVDRPLAVFIAAAVVGLALIGGTVAWMLGWFNHDTKPGSRQIGKNVKVPVDWATRRIRVYGENAHYQSLADALHAAQRNFQPKPGDLPDQLVIQVAAGTHDEQVHIDARKSEDPWPNGIIVRGEGDVIFRSESEGPVFSLQEVHGLTIENITIDAANRPIGMAVSGFLNDTTLSKLTVLHFTDAGLVLSGVLPLGTPLKVDQVRCESASDSAVGIRISPAKQDNRSEDTSNIAVTNGRFTGPMAAGIAIQGNSPHDVSIRESIFHQCTAGIRFDGAGGWRNIAITNNTFFECGVGIDYTTMPAGSANGSIVRRNVFAKTTTSEARVQNGYVDAAFAPMFAGGGLDWNWSDRAEPPSPETIESRLFSANGKRGIDFAFDSTSPDSPRFLAPSTSSPQKGGTKGAPPERDWVGAIGP